MSKDVIVLAPNGRRQLVKCTPDTTFLQVLEDVCEKHGFNPLEYDLKHHNRVLDLSNILRFSNLPNKAYLEMVQTDRPRVDSSVTIGLQLENGERLTGNFPPITNIHEVLNQLLGENLHHLQHPTVIYMRREVFGDMPLRETTLRDLGLFGGRAILRLIDKSPEDLKSQANVSSDLPRPPPKVDEQPKKSCHSPNPILDKKPETNQPKMPSVSEAGTSQTTDFFKKPFPAQTINPVRLLRKNVERKQEEETTVNDDKDDEPVATKQQQVPTKPVKKSLDKYDEEQIKRRLTIEENVTFVGSNKAILFKLSETDEADLEDLPDEFYELSIEEVRQLYRDLQTERERLESAPLLTAQARQIKDSQSMEQVLTTYKNAVVRIQFPDGIILQTVFQPTSTMQDIYTAVKEYLSHPNKPFHLFTTPISGNLKPNTTLAEARFVPCVLMHFKWVSDDGPQICLKKNLYSSLTSSSDANILASKYRAPSRRKIKDSEAGTSRQQEPSASEKESLLPKWLRFK